MSHNTRLVQGRTGFQDWNNHMTCVRVDARAEEVAAQLAVLASSTPVAPRAYQALLSLTWDGLGDIAVRCVSAATLEPITVSRPLPGPTDASCVIWLEASPATCSHSTLHDLGQELLAALRDALAISDALALVAASR